MTGEALGHVIVVEDDYDIGFLLMNTLGKEEWLKCVHISTAEASMSHDVWGSGDINVVGILDLFLPEYNGIEIAEWVKTNISEDIPLIAMTAASMYSDMYIEADNSGYFDHIFTKPLPISSLLNVIRETLNNG